MDHYIPSLSFLQLEICVALPEPVHTNYLPLLGKNDPKKESNAVLVS